MKTPDEIMTIIEQAQEQLDTASGVGKSEEFDLESLVWDIINDITSSFAIALECYEDAASDALTEVTDYVVNHYG